MNNFFSYESRPMQIMMFIGDLVILNLLFLICCIPLFTIGAAQAGLHTAIKVLLDPEDDSSPAAAFFRGFATGFGKVTLAWGLMTLVLLVAVWLGFSAVALGAPLWLVSISLILVAIFQSLVPAFHSRFDCKPLHLIRNCWFLLFAHPLRALGVTILIWIPMLPIIDLLLAIIQQNAPQQQADLYAFMRLTPLWGTIYFSGVFCFIHAFLKKPFKTAIDHFNETHGIKPEGEEENKALEDNTTEEEPAVPVE